MNCHGMFLENLRLSFGTNASKIDISFTNFGTLDCFSIFRNRPMSAYTITRSVNSYQKTMFYLHVISKKQITKIRNSFL